MVRIKTLLEGAGVGFIYRKPTPNPSKEGNYCELTFGISILILNQVD
jgi:hypothetical protein